MWHGIKPTRLWYKTGKIHMKNMLAARYSARLETEPPRYYNVRKREDLLTLYGVIMGSAAFSGYMFGAFSKPNDCKEVEEEEICPSGPCPAEEPPPRPKKCPKPKKKQP